MLLVRFPGEQRWRLVCRKCKWDCFQDQFWSKINRSGKEGEVGLEFSQEALSEFKAGVALQLGHIKARGWDFISLGRLVIGSKGHNLGAKTIPAEGLGLQPLATIPRIPGNECFRGGRVRVGWELGRGYIWRVCLCSLSIPTLWHFSLMLKGLIYPINVYFKCARFSNLG